MSRRPKPPIAVSQSLDMTATRWVPQSYGQSCWGMDATATACEPWGNAWTLRLPRVDDDPANKVGYVLCPHTVAITASRLEGTFSLTATPGTLFVDAKTPSNGVTPATFRFVIMSGMNSTDLADEFGRWWSNPVCLRLDELAATSVPQLMSVSLAPENWSSVYGKRGSDYTAAFNGLLSRPQFIGITCGAGGDFGHGIAVSGGYSTLKAEGIRLA
jgi:hypothetical protein